MPKEKKIKSFNGVESKFWHFVCENNNEVEFNYTNPNHIKLSHGRRRPEPYIMKLFSFKRKDYSIETYYKLPKVVFIQWKKIINNLIIGFIEYTLPISESTISKLFGKDIRLEVINRQVRTNFDGFCSIEQQPKLNVKCKNCKESGHDEYNCQMVKYDEFNWIDFLKTL